MPRGQVIHSSKLDRSCLILWCTLYCCTHKFEKTLRDTPPTDERKTLYRTHFVNSCLDPSRPTSNYTGLYHKHVHSHDHALVMCSTVPRLCLQVPNFDYVSPLHSLHLSGVRASGHTSACSDLHLHIRSHLPLIGTTRIQQPLPGHGQ